jgi:hypothetical protein
VCRAKSFATARRVPEVGNRTSSAGGFWMSLRTLSGLKGRSPVLDHPERIFREVNAWLRARLYRYVKCCFPIVLAPHRSNDSACSRYAVFSGEKTPTSQGCSLCDVCDGSRQRTIRLRRQNSKISRDSWVPNPSLIRRRGLFPASVLV